MRELTSCERIERSITKKYRKELWQPFIGAMKRYELVREGDKVAVRVGDDSASLLCAKLLQMLSRYSEIPFEIRFVGKKSALTDLLELPLSEDITGCNKTAASDTLDDITERLVADMFYHSTLRAVCPKEQGGIIRPLYAVRDCNIIKWCRYNELEYIPREIAAEELAKAKKLIAELSKNEPDLSLNIFSSLHSVNLDTFPGYERDGEEFAFSEIYGGEAL